MTDIFYKKIVTIDILFIKNSILKFYFKLSIKSIRALSQKETKVAKKVEKSSTPKISEISTS